jgi:hypothetical protein
MANKPLPDQTLLKQLLDYDPDTGRFCWRRRAETNFSGGEVKRFNKRYAGQPALETAHPDGYLTGTIMCSKVYAHRVAWKYMTGEDPEAVDHINHIGTDNRFANLRGVTQNDNVRNARRNKRNTSGVTGLSWHRRDRKWVVQISRWNQSGYVGRYACMGEAIRVRREAEKTLGFHKNHGRPG